MSVGRLRAEMSTREYAQWVAFVRYQAGRRAQEAAKVRMLGEVTQKRRRGSGIHR